MHRMGAVAVATVATVALVSACSGGSSPASNEAKPIDVFVPWEDYATEVRKTIDSLYAVGDCDLLQKQFDDADSDDDTTLNRTGHDNTALKKYIDTGLVQAGCKPGAPAPTRGA